MKEVVPIFLPYTYENIRLNKRFLDLCFLELCKSTINQRHGAVVVHKGNVVASHNYMKCDKDKRSIHAEVAAIQKFLIRHPKRFLKESALIVIRVNRKGHLCNSKPCDSCAKYISKHEIPVTFYS